MTYSTTQFTIGAEASCTDGTCGNLTQLVVDPLAQAVTHLVIEPKHRSGLGRLVPVDLVDVTAAELTLSCKLVEFEAMDHAEETHFLPGQEGSAYGTGIGQPLAWPYYALGGTGLSGFVGGSVGFGNVSVPVVSDTLPLGEVAVRRGDPVHATDGDIGKVQGLVIDQRNHHVTHVLLQEGHLWGRKEIAIPISAVTHVDGTGIFLNLTKQDIDDLPPAELQHPGL